MYSSLALAVALWPVEVTEHCPLQASATVIGVAVNSRGDFLYCEYFSQSHEQRVHIDYMRNNTSFASKELDYAISPYIPSVNQIDQRTGERRETRVDPQKIQLTYQTSSDTKPETASLAIGAVDVVDAGFDNFVKANWDKLLTGKALTINFGSIAHLKVLPLRIKSLEVSKCNLPDKVSAAEHCFSVAIDNALLRLLVDNIKISYDSKKRLRQFSGIVNLQDDLYKSQNARISYFYREDYLEK